MNIEGEHRVTEHEGPVCDFCLAPDPRWTFVCTEEQTEARIVVTAETTHRIIAQHSKEWAACTRCSNLIQRKNTARLADVAAREGMAAMNVQFLPTDVEVYAKRLRVWYDELIPQFGRRRAASAAERKGDGTFRVTRLTQGVKPDEN